MEVSRHKLFVVLDLIQVVREVSVLALLLEWTPCVFQVVDLVVYLFSASRIEAIVGLAFHVASLELSSAIRVLVLCVLTHFTELACIALLTVANLASLVVRAETIALEVVGSFLWHADCVLLDHAVCSMLAGLSLVNEEARVTLLT